MGFNLRFVIVAVLLAGVALLLHARSGYELIPSRASFVSFPRQLGEWTGTDLTITPDVLAVLGPGDFLLRDYHQATGETPIVELFLAYFPSQRAGDTIHSPRHCLPGAGWLPIQSGQMMISLPDRAPFIANRYLIAKGERRALAVYWFLAHNRVVANEYWAKFYLIEDSIRLNRSDGSLIRVSTELDQGETADQAVPRLESVIGGAVPVLDRYVPR